LRERLQDGLERGSTTVNVVPAPGEAAFEAGQVSGESALDEDGRLVGVGGVGRGEAEGLLGVAAGAVEVAADEVGEGSAGVGLMEILAQVLGEDDLDANEAHALLLEAAGVLAGPRPLAPRPEAVLTTI
jgi:hypothetical protein